MSSRSRKPTNSLDHTLKSTLRRKDPGPAVGIELEVEYPDTVIPATIVNDAWLTTGEGSLRNGVEYVSNGPQPLDSINEVIDNLYVQLPKRAKSTIRCSTHLHVNCLHLTFRQIFGAIAFYYLIEDLLVDKHPDNRKGNLFCLRMSDAENVWEDLLTSVTEAQQNGDPRMYFSLFSQDRHKYAALNLYMLKTLGTMEFRFMQAFLHRSGMAQWVDILTKVVYRGSAYEAEEHLRLFNDLDTTAYLSKILGEDHTRYLIEGKTKTEVNTLMHKNYDFVFDLARVLGTIRYFELPPRLWDSDLMEESLSPFRSASGRPYASIPGAFPHDPEDVPPEDVPIVHELSRGSMVILGSGQTYDDYDDAVENCLMWQSSWPSLNFYVAATPDARYIVVCHEILPLGIAYEVNSVSPVLSRKDISMMQADHMYESTASNTPNEADQKGAFLVGHPMHTEWQEYIVCFCYDEQTYCSFPPSALRRHPDSFAVMTHKLAQWEQSLSTSTTSPPLGASLTGADWHSVYVDSVLEGENNA